MISRHHSTIFVHIPKTAGQSVETLFLEDLGLKWRSLFPWNDRRRLLLKENRDRSKGPERLAHLYGDEYVSLGYVTPEEFSAFYKFAIVRDPYHRAVSTYNFRSGATGTLRDFLSSIPRDEHNDLYRHIAPQSRFVVDPATGVLLVDQIVTFEDMRTGLATAFERTLGRPAELPRKNISADKKLSVADLPRADLDYVEAEYAEDFARFGYPLRGA
ncbi:sulfotransferase family 2 domain-containing protein [Roseisalinus antarcticus]|uniref:Sulfotransferase family protein n=1 Tax=Roseisalinus antarcticus TaxID=254357 RepID=A0A1Y5TVA2_9RHOB|nr:sulfotransferase family 2 domain-containing protein [Roseisalinus antarcticus]SLN69249.1 Sulfotransferase family protein [Roseisalinus antarcticus]